MMTRLAQGLHHHDWPVTFDLAPDDIAIIVLGESDDNLVAYAQHDILHYVRQRNPAALVVLRIGEAIPHERRVHQAAAGADVVVFDSQALHDHYTAQGLQHADLRIIPLPPDDGDITAWVAAYHSLFQALVSARETVIARREWPALLSVAGDEPGRWLRDLRDPLLDYLSSLRRDTTIGNYRMTVPRPDAFGASIALPFSTWALKVRYMLNDDPSPPNLAVWVQYIQSFQVLGNPGRFHRGENAFIDPRLLEGILRQMPRAERLRARVVPQPGLTRLSQILSAETKQAIATLAQYERRSLQPYKGFPGTPRQMGRYLNALDWSRPWMAGAHVATLAVFLQLEAPRFLDAAAIAALRQHLITFIEQLVDSASGAYFQHEQPPYGETVNGAMKILTALDWLDVPVHYPERLIDMVLADKPAAEGCHLVDAVYVLYRCTQHTSYRKDDIVAYARDLVEMMVAHFNPLDGGFSYYSTPHERKVHNIRVAFAHGASDLHGTVLLTWAAAMLLHMLDVSHDWRIIKP
ncbi:MAG: hypothetical protein ACLFTK_05895 [Anaerolineales bacterium]